MQDLIDEFGGQQVYIPKTMPDPSRNQRIITIFSESLKSGSTCMNAYQRAADEEGLSLRRVQEIVASA
jgi:hypothetical protein